MSPGGPRFAPVLGLLARRRFWPLFVVQFGGALNDNVLRNAIVAMVAFGGIAGEAAAGDKALIIQAAVALFMLPFLLFSPAAGMLADSCPDRAVAVRWLKAGEIATAGLAAIGLFMHSLPLLLAALFLSGCQSALFGPFKYSLLPVILRRHELIGGNALQSASTYVAILIGVAWGTRLGAAGPQQEATAAVLAAIAVAGFAASMLMLPLPLPDSAGWKAAIRINFVAAAARVVRGVAARREIMVLVLLSSWFWGSGTLVLIQLPVVVRDCLGFGHDVYLLLLMVVCLAVAAGSLAAALVLRRQVSLRHVGWAIAAAAAALLLPVWPPDAAAGPPAAIDAFFASESAGPIVFMLAALSAAMGFYIVPVYAAMQAWVPDAIRGQTIAANNVFNALFIALGATGAGLFVGSFAEIGAGTYRLFVILGVAGLAIALWCARYLAAVERRLAGGG